MKRYIKPNTGVHNIELQQIMVAASTRSLSVSNTEQTEGWASGKETETSSSSIWGEEE